MASEAQQRLLPGEEKPPSTRRIPRKRANDLDGAAWLRNSISVWDDIRKTSEELALKHPAMFPAQLVTRLIESLTTSDQRVVLDPFVGVGSTVVAAEAAGKIGIGLDLSVDYITKAHTRSQQFLNGAASPGERQLHVADARDLLQFVEPEYVDLVVTSPPYWDILQRNRTADYKDVRHYGNAQGDLGTIAGYHAFLEELAEVFSKVYQAMKPGAYCCVVVMDLRKKERFYPFHSDLAQYLERVGFILDDIIIWDRSSEYNNLRPLGHPSVFRINKVHEYINIFQKPR